MTDLEKLKVALRRMEAAEGKDAVDSLVLYAAISVCSRDDWATAKGLTRIDGLDMAGALEVLARTAWAMNVIYPASGG